MESDDLVARDDTAEVAEKSALVALKAIAKQMEESTQRLRDFIRTEEAKNRVKRESELNE